ncbi:MAG: hypothetical protein EBR91_09550 [Flavobacteriia bacterium]|nr:hypothetical protein [Flavobacteriia bacterium]
MEPLTVSCEVVNPLLNTGVAFTVNVLLELVPSVVLLVAESKPLIVAVEPTSTVPLTVICEADNPVITDTDPDNVVEPFTASCDDVNPLLNVGVAFTVNVLLAFVPSVVLLNAFNAPLTVVPEPTKTDPLTVNCDEIIPLLNTGVAFTVNILLDEEPIVVLLNAANEPLIVDPDPTNKAPLTVNCEAVRPLLNTGVAFTVKVLLDEVPSTVLLVAVSNPLIVSFNPTRTEPLTVTCDTVNPEGTITEPDKVVVPDTTRLVEFNPLVNDGVAFTVNVLAELEPIIVLLTAVNTPLIVAPVPTSTDPLTVS